MKAPQESEVMTPQAFGAYGERIVEAELLRQNWLPGNLNHSVSNSERFDIIAVKIGTGCIVPIRVKTCSSKYSDFQFSVKNPESSNPLGIRDEGDFIILVAMGNSRGADELYILPTRRVQDDLLAWIKFYRDTPKKDGGLHVLTTQWTLRLKGNPDKLNCGFEQKWKDYQNNWGILDP
jgi:hypothetical protein